jgi:hypothetical protein
VEPIPATIGLVANAPHKAATQEALDDLGGGGSIQRDSLPQRFLVDVLLRAKRIKDGKLRRGHLAGHLRVPEPFVDLLNAPNQMAGMAAQVFMRG